MYSAQIRWDRTLELVSDEKSAGQMVAEVLAFLRQRIGEDVYHEPYGHPTWGPALYIPADEIARNGGKVPKWANGTGEEDKGSFRGGFNRRDGTKPVMDRKLYHVSQGFDEMVDVGDRYQRAARVFITPQLTELRQHLDDFVAQASRN